MLSVISLHQILTGIGNVIKGSTNKQLLHSEYCAFLLRSSTVIDLLIVSKLITHSTKNNVNESQNEIDAQEILSYID